MGRQYKQCVRQVAHQTRCVTRDEEVCQWLQVWTNTCTHQILSKCLHPTATELLVKLKSRLVLESHLKLEKLCGSNDIDVVHPVHHAKHQDNIISSRWLRLG